MECLPDPCRLAQRELDAACDCLIDPSPANLDRSAAALSNAAGYLADLRPKETGEARKLRASVTRVRRLLETAAGHQRQWQRILLAAVSNGYTAGGEPAALATSGRVSVEG